MSYYKKGTGTYCPITKPNIIERKHEMNCSTCTNNKRCIKLKDIPIADQENKICKHYKNTDRGCF